MQRILVFGLLLLAVLLVGLVVLLLYRPAPTADADPYQPRLGLNPPPPEPPQWATDDFNTFLARLREASADARSLLLDEPARELAEQAFRNTPGVSNDVPLALHEPFFVIDPAKIFRLYHDLPALERGLALYQQHCASCHGVYGRGNGPATRQWHTGNYPRNFWYGYYKNRSTHYGEVPTDSDLYRTLTRGLYGTAMPSYRHLNPRDRWSLIQFLKSLAHYYEEGRIYTLFDPEFNETPVEPIEIGPEPSATPESIARGKELFTKNGCVKCHQGDQPQPIGLHAGPDNDSLDWKDEMYRPVLHSRDLTSGIYHTGAAASDLFRFITAGSPIGPMPSSSEIPPADRWALVHYLRSLWK